MSSAVVVAFFLGVAFCGAVMALAMWMTGGPAPPDLLDPYAQFTLPKHKRPANAPNALRKAFEAAYETAKRILGGMRWRSR